jgi:hypothetical protein
VESGANGSEFCGASAAGGGGIDWYVRTLVMLGTEAATDDVWFLQSEWTLWRTPSDIGKLRVEYAALMSTSINTKVRSLG